MELISDNILVDSAQLEPTYPAVYPSLEGKTELWNPSSWTKGHHYGLYEKMRAEAPVMWSKMGRNASQFWSVTRYEDIKAVELQPDVFSSQRGSINMAVADRKNWNPEQLFRAAFDSLINMDAPHHMDMRVQQMKFFVPAYVNELKEKVGIKIDSLLDDLEREGPVVDFARAFSQELPLFTLSEMLGIDEEDRPKIIKWMHYLELSSQFLTNPLQTFFSEPMFPFRFKGAVRDMFAYGESVMQERRTNPRPDLLSAIAHSELDGKLLPQEFLDGSWLLIIFAGNDTTRNSLSGTIKLMTEFPDQKAMLLEDMSLVPRMSQEALRMISPVMHMRRTAVQDTELNGQRIGKDEKIVLWYGAGNRDPSVFPDPDRFDMMRDNIDKHIAFGHGVHKCLGMRIAQMQLQLSYQKIFERFPNIEWTGHIKIAPNTLVHAISSLNVNLYGKNGARPAVHQVKTPASAA